MRESSGDGSPRFSPRFSEEFIERVLDANNIVDIISQHTQLKSSSSGFMGRCPFPEHPEKTPSFSVSESKQVYYCFGCHKKGNLITFLRDFNGLTYVQALEYLADRANIPLPISDQQLSTEEQARTTKRKQLLQIYERAKNLYRGTLKTQSEAAPVRVYVKRRGISNETAETFQIGYAPAEWDSLVQDLSRQELPFSLAEEGRLIRAREGKSGHYDFFRDRLMFPVHNFKGEVIAFGGRIIQEGEPKYLNSPEHFLFSKRKTLYGLFITGKYIRSEDCAVIVEGYMDLVSLYQAGIRNVVASMGTALTLEQAQMLKRMTNNVVVLFDGDSAGINAAEKALPILLSAGLRPKGITLPDGQDPDDFVRKSGPDALKNLIHEAKDLFFLVLHNQLNQFRGDPAEKLKLAEETAQTLQAIPDSRLKDLYEKELIFRLGVEPKWLKNLVAQGNSKPAGSEPKKDFSKEIPKDELFSADEKVKIASAPSYLKLLIALSLENQTLFQRLVDAPWLREIPHPGIQDLIARSLRIYRQAPEKFDKLTGLLMTFVDQSEALILPASLRRSAQDTLTKGDSEDDSVFDDANLMMEYEKLWMDCVRKFRDENLAARAKEIQLQLRSGSSPELLQELQSIHLDRRKLMSDPNYVRKTQSEENL